MCLTYVEHGSIHSSSNTCEPKTSACCQGRDGLDPTNILASRRLHIPHQRKEIVSLVERDQLLQAETAAQAARDAAEQQVLHQVELDEPRGLDDEHDELDEMYLDDLSTPQPLV